MTVGTEVSSVEYAGDGSSVAFTIPFRFLADADVYVALRDADGNVSQQVSGFTLFGAGGATGTCTFDTAPSADVEVYIARAPQILQPGDFTSNDRFPAETVEQLHDRQTFISQYLRDLIRQCIRLPFGDGASAALPSAQARASKYLAFGADGAPALAALTSSGPITQEIIGGLLYPQTAAEAVAGLTPADSHYPPGDSRRSDLDITGAADVTDKIQAMLDAAGLESQGGVKIVTLYPGTYKVRRLYMRYSNVWLELRPGAILQQTRTGITDANTTGQPPAYAVIHINPLAYVVAPAVPVTAIQNVRIYGGGTVKGPYTTDGAYDGYSLGIVSNDCHNCVVQAVKVMDCRAENILHNPSGYNTVRGVKILSCEMVGGGEVGINNARDFAIFDNDVHDSWMQNGVGGNGDGGMVCFNRIRSMARGGMTIGGSGAADINECRNVIYGFNTVQNCNTDDAGAYAVFLSDDGATTTPKNSLKFIGNIVDLCNGNTLMACDYASGRVEIADNVFRSLTGPDPTLLNFIDGACSYILRDNSFVQGSGNAARCLDITGGAPVVTVEDGNYFDPTITTDIQGTADFSIRCERNGTFLGTLTGCTTAPTTSCTYTRKGNRATVRVNGVIATSSATTMTITGIPAEIRPADTQNFLCGVRDNGSDIVGLGQVLSTGVLQFYTSVAAAAFTGSGTKGLPGPIVISYLLN